MKFWQFSYNTKYYLLHTWCFVEDFIRSWKFAFQRMFRGYDDSASWDIPTFLRNTIPHLLKKIKDSKGCPGILFPGDFLPGMYDYTDEQHKQANKEWHDILDEIIFAFENIEEIRDFHPYKHHPLYDKFDRGMSLFKEYFFCLWW